jgi:phosphoribosylamine---glycine ligase
MKFLLYSQCGEGAQVLKRIALEGNDCAIYIKDKYYKTVFDGLLEKTENPESFIDKETVILFDMSGNGSIADSFRRREHYVYGASAFADDLEHDRNFGFKAMEEVGIKLPEYKEFKDWNEAKQYVKDSKTKLVFKPNGTMPCKLTYCSSSAEELEHYMNFVEKQFGKDIESFILQEFIEGSVVSSEFFCDGTKFLWPPNHTVEVKKSMNDDLGPSTGCSGNITWPCIDDSIITKGIMLAEDICIKHQYIGQIDLNTVVNDTGVYGLEWTPRFGYDATPTFLTLLNQDFGEFFSNITRGQQKEIDVHDEYAGGIRITIPPYPVETDKDPEKFSPSIGVPIQNYEENCDDLYFYEVCMENDNLLHSGGSGVIACAVGMGEQPEQCLKNPYKVLEELTIPDKQYRTDLSKVLSKMTKECENYAY